MRSFFTAIAAMILVACTQAPAHSQVGFLLGLGAGAMIAGGDAHSGASSNILYTLPRASERVVSPLKMRHSVKGTYGHPGQTLQQYFEATFDKPASASTFEILQVSRATGNGEVVYLWFLYTEKDNVLALEKLPVRKQD